MIGDVAGNARRCEMFVRASDAGRSSFAVLYTAVLFVLEGAANCARKWCWC